jgi:hypothetical protein
VSDEDEPRGFRDFLLGVVFIIAIGILCGIALALVAAIFAG